MGVLAGYALSSAPSNASTRARSAAPKRLESSPANRDVVGHLAAR
jgi:hypothetical protein